MAWKCEKCEERCEDSFDLCWNCGTARDSVEVPAVVPEALAEAAEVARRPASAKRKSTGRLIVTTGNEIVGRPISSYLGIVRGIVVRSPGIGQNFMGGLKQIVGGNIEAFAEVCEAARREAYDRMVKQAKMIEADAIIGMRYDATEFSPGVTEVLAYGTACKLEPKE